MTTKRTVAERVHEIETTMETAKASARYWELEARRFRLLFATAAHPGFSDAWLAEHAPFTPRGGHFADKNHTETEAQNA